MRIFGKSGKTLGLKSSLPSLCAIAIAALPATFAEVRAQSPVPAAETPAPTAKADVTALPDPATAEVPTIAPAQLLLEAQTAVGRRHSITALVRFHAELFGRDVVGNGVYLQGPVSSRLVRYELHMLAGERRVHLLEINDGRHLWRRMQYKAEPDVERIDVDRVLAALHQPDKPSGVDPTILLSIGGLGRLLIALNHDFDFSHSVPADNLGDVPVFGIAGRWKPEALTRLGAESVDKLRPHVPDYVVILLGRDDLFPYQIEYRRTAGGAGQGSAPQERRLLKLEFHDVRFDVPVDAAQFHFAAEHLHFVDVTDRAIIDLATRR